MTHPAPQANLSTGFSCPYQVITLKEFSGLDLIILDSADYGDFVVLRVVVPGGGMHLAVQGVLRGDVLFIPPLTVPRAP